jgi:5-methylthioadenosine/S-adenosylhomocysteine deaminase
MRHLLTCVTGVALAVSLSAQTAPRQVTTIVAGGIVVTVDGARNIYNPGAVAIEGTTIAAVGTAADIATRFKAAEQINTVGSIVIPGLINTHGHAPMVLYRGLADDLRLQEWLEKYIFPAEAKTVSREMVRAGTRLAALEMIQSGTTAHAYMYYFV